MYTPNSFGGKIVLIARQVADLMVTNLLYQALVALAFFIAGQQLLEAGPFQVLSVHYTDAGLIVPAFPPLTIFTTSLYLPYAVAASVIAGVAVVSILLVRHHMQPAVIPAPASLQTLIPHTLTESIIE